MIKLKARPDTRADRPQESRQKAVRAPLGAQDRLNSLPEGQQAAIQKRAAQMPVRYRKTYLRAMSGRSRRAAMNAFCLECTQWQKGEVRRCTSLACPLYPYRPYR